MKILNDIKFRYLMMQAVMLMRLNKPEGAVSMLEENSSMFDAYPALEGAQYSAYWQAQRWDDAIQALTRLEEKHPEWPSLTWNLGTSLLQLSRHEEASHYLERCVKEVPENEHYLSSLGNCYLYMEAFDKAEEVYNKVVRIAPWNPETCYSLSLLYLATSRFERIEGLFLGYIGRYPSLYVGYAYLGNHVQYKMNDPQGSLPWYTNGVALLGNSKMRKYLEGYALISDWKYIVGDEYCKALTKTGRKGEALRYIRRNILFHPFDPAYRSSLIEYHLWTGEYKLAEREAIKGYKNDSKWLEYLLLQSRSLLRQDRPAEALAIAEKLLGLQRENPFSWPLLGEVRGQLKDWQGAVEAYREALRINPFDIEALEGISAGLQKLGLFEDALTFAKKATLLDPMNRDAWNDLSQVCTRLGKKDEATAAAQKAADLRYAADIQVKDVAEIVAERMK